MNVRPPPWIAGPAWLLAAGIGAAMSWGCLRADLDHCHHNGGDAACGPDARFCDACSSSQSNNGCVVDAPKPACASTPGAAEDSSGSSSTGGGTESTSTDAVPVACAAVNARDEACSVDRPYCVDETCIDCLDGPLGGDALCATADSELPSCAPSGQCVACNPLAPASCPAAGEFCQTDGTCGGCFAHEQCGEHGCDLTTGQCMSGFIIWMESISPLPADPDDCGFGTAQDPYCKLTTVATEIAKFDEVGTEVTVRMRPGQYPQSFVYDGPALVALVIEDPDGGDDFGARIAADSDTSAIAVSGGARILTNGLRFVGDTAPTIACEDSTVWLQDFSVVDGDGIAMRANNCDVIFERGIVAGNAGGGIEAVDSMLALTSTGVATNGNGTADAPGVFVDGGTLFASHATIASNQAAVDGRNLRCRSAQQVIVRNSIIMGDGPESISGCNSLDVTQSVVDIASLESPEFGVRFFEFDAAFFVGLAGGDPRLRSTAPFDGFAVWAPGDPALDIDRERLAAFPGATNDPGCDQRTAAE